MQQKIIKIFTFIILIVILFSIETKVEASQINQGGVIYTLKSDNTYEVTSLVNYYSTIPIIVPDKINNIKVTSIGDEAFYKLSVDVGSKATSITFENPSNILSIGHYAFEYVIATNNLSFPNVQYIGNSAFSKSNFSEININPNISAIGQYVFFNAKATNALTFNNLSTIEGYAFAFSNFREININSNISSIGSGAFYETKATNTITFNNLTTIEGYAFTNSNFREININPNVSSIGKFAFYETKATNAITFNNLTTVPERAFTSSNFREININPNVSFIGLSSFYGAKATNTITFNNLTTIEGYAFSSSNFSEININPNVSSIGIYAFTRSKATNAITFNNLTTIPQDVFTNSNFSKINLNWNHLHGISSLNTFKTPTVSFTNIKNKMKPTMTYQLTPERMTYRIQKSSGTSNFVYVGNEMSYTEGQDIDVLMTDNQNYRVELKMYYKNLLVNQTYHSHTIKKSDMVLIFNDIEHQVLANKNETRSLNLSQYLPNNNINDLTITLNSLHNNVSIYLDNNKNLIISPTNVGEDTIVVTVSDGIDSITKTFNVTVNNRLPVEVSPIPNQVLENKTVTKTINLNNHFNELDGQNLTYTVSSNNSNIITTISDSILTLQGNNVGSSTITITVSDGIGSITKTFTTNVNNRLPIEVSPILNQVLENKTVSKTINLNNHFNELDGQTLTYTVSINNSNLIATLSGSTLTLKGNNVGSSIITVTISDGIGSITKTFTTTVNNRLPVETTIIPNQVLENKTISKTINLSNHFSEPDNQNLTYTVTSNNNNLMVSVSGSILTLKGNNVGSSTITIVVSDGIGSITKTFTTTVNNRLPVEAMPISNQILENKTVSKTIDLSNHFNELDEQTLIYTVSSNNNNVITTISDSILTLQGNYVGLSTITVNVSDGFDSITKTFTTNVNNRLPIEVSPIQNQVLENKTVTKTIDLNNHFSELDEQTLTYMVSSNNSNVIATVNDSMLTLQGNYVGSSTITLTISDGIGSITKTFTVNVEAEEFTFIEDEPPALSGDTTIIDINDLINNPDNKDISYTIEVEKSGIFTAELINNELIITPIQAGTDVVILTVTDGTNTLVKRYVFTVYESNLSDEKATLRLEEGEFSLATSDITSFGKVQLKAAKQTITTNFENEFTVIDARGTQQGYHVNVSATPFVEDTFDGFIGQPVQLPIGTLSLNGTENITQVGTVHNSQKPTNEVKVSTIIDSGDIKLIKANDGQGMGEFVFTFNTDSLSMVVDATTAKIDKVNYPNTDTPYTSTVTFNLITGP